MVGKKGCFNYFTQHFPKLCYALLGYCKTDVNMQQSAFWSMIACVNVSVGYWFPGGLLCVGFIRPARWQVYPTECLIKVQLTLPAKGRGAISLPICSAKALPDMFFCSHSTSCHPGSHQSTDPNIPAFSEPPCLIQGQTGLQHKHASGTYKSRHGLTCAGALRSQTLYLLQF